MSILFSRDDEDDASEFLTATRSRIRAARSPRCESAITLAETRSPEDRAARLPHVH